METPYATFPNGSGPNSRSGIDGQTLLQRFPAAGMEAVALKPSRKAKAEPPKPTAIVPEITYHGFCGTCATRSTEVASSR